MSAAAVFYELHLLGGGGDLSCNRCLPVQRDYHSRSVVSVARIDAPGEECPICGIRQGEEHDPVTRRAGVSSSTPPPERKETTQ